jgi:hypothetical protein
MSTAAIRGLGMPNHFLLRFLLRFFDSLQLFHQFTPPPGACQKSYRATECLNCQELPSNQAFAAILDRISNGVHKNTPLAFHPITQLVETAETGRADHRFMPDALE